MFELGTRVAALVYPGREVVGRVVGSDGAWIQVDCEKTDKVYWALCVVTKPVKQAEIV